MLKAVLFDMDGVLFNSMPDHAECWMKAAAQFGLAISKEDVYMNEGRTGEDTITMFTRLQKGRDPWPGECAQIYAAKCKLFEAKGEPAVMAGAPDVVHLTKAAGLITGIVTGSGQKALLGRLEKNFPQCFLKNHIVSSSSCQRGKPYPDPYLLGLERVGVSAEEAVVIENAPLGVQAACAAGIRTIAVNTGGLDEKVLYDAGAAIVFPSMTELAKHWTLNVKQ